MNARPTDSPELPPEFTDQPVVFEPLVFEPVVDPTSEAIHAALLSARLVFRRAVARFRSGWAVFGVRHLLAAMLGAAAFCGVWAYQPWLAPQDEEWLRRARAFETADIRSEVQAAIRAGDVRLVGVNGERLLILGAPGAGWGGEGPNEDVRIIQETSNRFESTSHRRFVESARTYAWRYNTLMLQQRGNRFAAPKQAPKKWFETEL